MNDTITPLLKRCNTCGKEYPAMHEWFYPSESNKDGLNNTCILCKRKKSRKHGSDASARLPIRGFRRSYPKLYRQLYYEENREQIIATNRQYRVDNAERIRVMRPTWKSQQNSPARQEYMRQYRAMNLDRCRANARRVQHRRRARLRQQSCSFSADDNRRMMDYWHHSCAVCGRTADLFSDIVADHWIAITRGGGSTAGNLVPLCHTKPGGATGLVSCNQSKGDKDPGVWLEQRFGKRKAKAIMGRVQAYFDSLIGKG